MASDVIREKTFPGSYSNDVLDIINKLSMTDSKNITVMGSMGLRSQFYAGDYDLIERVTSDLVSDTVVIDKYVKKFQSIIKHLLNKKDCYIGDIKSGEIPEWKVIPNSINDFSFLTSRTKLKLLLDTNVITLAQYNESSPIIKRNPTLQQFIIMKRSIKYHIIRWTPSEIIGGAKKLSDGRTYFLYEAFMSKSLTKLDIIAFVENARFTDFSIIYIFENNGIVLNDAEIGSLEESIKEDVIYYESRGMWFKVAKRLFSLARLSKSKNKRKIDSLNEILNSDLGRLYSIISDAGTILYLLENEKNIPISKIRYELDQFRSRFANIYTLNSIIRKEPFVLESILKMETLPTTVIGRKRLIRQMETLVEFFEGVLNRNAKIEIEGL